ncbi:MAG: dephospho-CoA kinase [Acidobacteria bacterium]|nr:dephospho-CoA kinase [Acidobacteriota bacterium]
MLKVGLTGSIAVGKSHVLALLGERGCMILDADHIAHDAILPPSEAYRELVEAFGPGILGAGGRIERARLGAIVFADAEKRARLNAIVHPRVRETIEQSLAAFAATNPGGIAVVDAALIIEAGMREAFDRLIVVYCDPQEQRRRVMARDRISAQEAERRIGAQLSSDQKRRYADYEIDTTDAYEATRAQVIKTYQQLQTLARGS